MRVVGGSARGRRLQAPPGRSIRPTSDRVREAVFNMLGDVVAGSGVLDLFAGSGALGLEALSRGAAHVTFVDHERKAVAVIGANLDALGWRDRARVVRDDALRFLRRADPVDLAFADPPYRFDGWDVLLGVLAAEVAVLESDRPLRLPERWRLLRERRHGGTVVTLARSAGSASS